MLSTLLLKIEGAAHFYEESSVPWGVDSEFAAPLPKKKPLQKSSIITKSCESMIRFFQVHISPIDGPRSSYYPTSSQYALDAIRKYGVMKGIALGCDRLMRENGDTWVYPLTSDYGPERKIDPVR